MLVTIQFPIVDFRRFVQDNVGLIDKPSWPDPGNDHSFVRSFGRIERRPKGGLTGWIGETWTCKANNAFQFLALPVYKDERGNTLRFRIAFRRFYFDGLALGKFEVGIVVWGFHDRKYWILGHRSLSPKSANGLLYHILNFQIAIRSAKGTFIGSLIDAGNSLAEHYEACTTKQPMNLAARSKNYVKACNSCVIISYQEHKENLHFPFSGKSMNIVGNYSGCLLSSYTIPNTYPGMPLLAIGELTSDNAIRDLRIYVLRLHAEKECLRYVLHAVKDGTITVGPRSIQSRRLQVYLREASRHIRKLHSHCNKSLEGEIEYLSFSALDVIAPGERDEILRSLRIIDAEKNVLGLVQEWIENTIRIDVENINVGKVQHVDSGILINTEDSPGASISAKQDIATSLDTMDLKRLSEELGRLQLAIMAEKPSQQQRKDLASLAIAEEAAIQNNPNKVSECLRGLKSSGAWILGIAEKIGVPLALEALKVSLGLTL